MRRPPPEVTPRARPAYQNPNVGPTTRKLVPVGRARLSRVCMYVRALRVLRSPASVFQRASSSSSPRPDTRDGAVRPGTGSPCTRWPVRLRLSARKVIHLHPARVRRVPRVHLPVKVLHPPPGCVRFTSPLVKYTVETGPSAEGSTSLSVPLAKRTTRRPSGKHRSTDRPRASFAPVVALAEPVRLGRGRARARRRVAHGGKTRDAPRRPDDAARRVRLRSRSRPFRAPPPSSSRSFLSVPPRVLPLARLPLASLAFVSPPEAPVSCCSSLRFSPATRPPPPRDRDARA